MRSATRVAAATVWGHPALKPVAVYVLVPALLLAITAGYMSLVRYVDRDPGFCAQCHETRNEYTVWLRSEHHDIICQECHHQSSGQSLEILSSLVMEGRTGPGDKGKRTMHIDRVSADACGKCHLRHDEKWPEIGGSLGHRIHMSNPEITCMSCHARSIHKFGDAAEACGDCHEREVKAEGMSRLHCLACHNFFTRDETIKPSRQVCIDCHRSSGLLDPPLPDNAAMVKLRCWACHRPHEPKGTEKVECIHCHDQITAHGLHELEEHKSCGDCHEAHTWSATRRNCTTCHREMVSHYAHQDCWECHSFGLKKEAEENGP